MDSQKGGMNPEWRFAVQRKKFDREFKVNAVKLALEGRKPQRQVAFDLGVGFSTLQKWISQFRADPEHSFPGKGRLKPADRELAELRRENEYLRIEKEILKKAMALFATPRGRNSRS